MKITKLELKNFKRFDDLTIDLTSLVEPAKLVLLIGANGSGKSSVFDGFEVLNKIYKGEFVVGEANIKSWYKYYDKINHENFKISLICNNDRTFSSDYPIAAFDPLNKSIFYGRTSIRQTPKLTRTALGRKVVLFEEDSDRPRSFIDRDDRFENDIENITLSILNDVFKGQYSTKKIIDSYIDPINKALTNIFGSKENNQVILTSFKPPLEGNTAEILFKKGSSTIEYDLLSSGEKEIFNILLNLLTRKEYFQDTIYFLDEIDLHLNTQLQKNLLKEITENWIPENCQLWTASHSLGFIKYANEAEHAAIIDFDNLNFDVPQVITPSPKKNFDVFEIAVSKEFLSKVFEGKKIIFSENLDTSIYNSLNITDTIFFNTQNKADVFHKTKNNPSYNGLIDRDYLTDDERVDLLQRYKNLFILNYYSIENYLFHPDNLEEYYKYNTREFNKDNYLNSIRVENRAIRDKILVGLMVARDSYPFYRENENFTKLKAIRPSNQTIIEMFDSEDFETFYKVFPAKDYGKQILERQNLNPADLAKTNWFKVKIAEILTK